MNVYYVDMIQFRGGYYRGQAIFSYTHGYVPFGVGTLTWPNVCVYEGNFVKGLFSGYGYFKNMNGDYYKGEYVDDMRHGIGEYYQALTQKLYIGGFRMDIEDGNAVITKVDSDKAGGRKRYEGEVRNGRRQGNGKLFLTQPDGQTASFEGTWVNDLLNGPGTQISANGRSFSGDFVDGYLEGYGRCKAEDGKTYDVFFSQGVVMKWY